MQKIIAGHEVKLLDRAYINQTGISSFDLMERAASAFCRWYISHFNQQATIGIICGTGNNGGDGLAISRLLSQQGYQVSVYYIGDLDKASPDFSQNFNLLPQEVAVTSVEVLVQATLQVNVIVDAVFGVGINRPLDTTYLALIQKLNTCHAIKIAVDLPSGLPSDSMLQGEAFIADYTVSFQFPKLSLLLPEHALYTGALVVLDIGIPPSFFETYSSARYFVQKQDILSRHKVFHRFSHKGSFGKVLLVGGSYGKIGSIRLSSQAALRTGSGLVSCFVPQCGVDILQSSLPEVMVESSNNKHVLSKEGLPELERFDAIGVGPGMGTSAEARDCLIYLLEKFEKPMVLDADAINIIAANRELLSLLRAEVILTPHLIEFERLVGKCRDQIERMDKALAFCEQYPCVLVLKGANTVITTPDGEQYFNSSGTQFMATAGAGDVLTGMLSSFLGQGYQVGNAAICGVYHHGLAGELASSDKGRGTIATDIVENIPATYQAIAGKAI